jgi:hypothetical protein
MPLTSRSLTLIALSALSTLVVARAAALSAAEFPEFKAVTIDPHAGEIVYAVTVADVDADGRPDIVAVTENRVLWYQAPDWKKRIIIENQTERDNVCIAPHDIDGDGKIDFALGAGWLNGKNLGTIQWLSRGESLDEKWNVHLIGAIPWTHRMRWADVLGSGENQLVVSPLNKTEGDGVKLTAFAIPDDPKSERWPATVLDDSLNKMHNHWHFRRPRHTVDATLTASEEGVHLVYREDGELETFQIPSTQAAGEVKYGLLREGESFIATIEPMHGNQVVVYPEGDGPVQQRVVLDATLGRGHGLWAANVDNDPADELVVGHSDPATGEIKGPGVYVYDAQDDAGTKWTKHVIDNGGIATEDLIAADLTGDGKTDIVAGGRATHNIKLYVNQGK